MLRSSKWLEGDDEVALMHRIALNIPHTDVGRPIIGIADTSSALNPCNSVFDDSIPALEAAIRKAGGVPARFPVTSLGEDLMKPSAMLYRNMVAMELEENVRAYPVDAVVYLANCDKSVPAAIMAAASINLPSLVLLGGPRPAPVFRGKALGTGTDTWRMLDEYRAGRIDHKEWGAFESALRCGGRGACNTMGTASTMAIVSEVLGMSLPGSACTPANSIEAVNHAGHVGERIVEMVRDDFRPSRVLTQPAIENAITAVALAGGSTNAVIHLAAIANRCGLDATLARCDRIWRDTPLLVDVEPCGKALIQAFSSAGGVPELMRTAAEFVHTDAITAAGVSWASITDSLPVRHDDSDIIRGPENPVASAPVLAVVTGNLAPDGAVIKVAAASSMLLRHAGKAVVFDDYERMRHQLDDPSRTYSESDVLIIRECGPKGVPGMPEWGMAPIPKTLLDQGVSDMVRITDGRMSGTSFGTVVLHVAPESAVGGPLALVKDGDIIVLDVEERSLRIDVEEEELASRRAAWTPKESAHTRGWPAMYREHVLQAPEGCDLDFLTGQVANPTFVEPVVGRS